MNYLSKISFDISGDISFRVLSFIRNELKENFGTNSHLDEENENLCKVSLSFTCAENNGISLLTDNNL